MLPPFYDSPHNWYVFSVHSLDSSYPFQSINQTGTTVTIADASCTDNPHPAENETVSFTNVNKVKLTRTNDMNQVRLFALSTRTTRGSKSAKNCIFCALRFHFQLEESPF